MGARISVQTVKFEFFFGVFIEAVILPHINNLYNRRPTSAKDQHCQSFTVPVLQPFNLFDVMSSYAQVCELQKQRESTLKRRKHAPR